MKRYEAQNLVNQILTTADSIMPTPVIPGLWFPSKQYPETNHFVIQVIQKAFPGKWIIENENMPQVAISENIQTIVKYINECVQKTNVNSGSFSYIINTYGKMSYPFIIIKHLLPSTSSNLLTHETTHYASTHIMEQICNLQKIYNNQAYRIVEESLAYARQIYKETSPQLISRNLNTLYHSEHDPSYGVPFRRIKEAFPQTNLLRIPVNILPNYRDTIYTTLIDCAVEHLQKI